MMSGREGEPRALTRRVAAPSAPAPGRKDSVPPCGWRGRGTDPDPGPALPPHLGAAVASSLNFESREEEDRASLPRCTLNFRSSHPSGEPLGFPNGKDGSCSPISQMMEGEPRGRLRPAHGHSFLRLSWDLVLAVRSHNREGAVALRSLQREPCGWPCCRGSGGRGRPVISGRGSHPGCHQRPLFSEDPGHLALGIR